MTVQAVVASKADRAPSGQWRRHAALSWALRVAIVAVPVLISFCVALLLSALLPRVTNVSTALLWIGVVGGVSLLTLVIFERIARRLLPLAALLNIALLFPDRAPSRFAVARRSGRQRDLHQALHDARSAGHFDEAARMQTVIELVLALSVHDRATRGHSERVRVFTDMLAEEMNVSAEGRARLRWTAMLHDIGKLEVPASTLNKRGLPNDHEWIALHRHPEEGAHLVEPLLPWLGEWGTAVEQHHERHDGTGYPHGLRGEEISIAARIVSLADAYEVMTAPRSYKRPMTVVAARRELVRVAGTQLDPMVVRAFLNISVGRLWRTVGVAAWVAQFPLVLRLASGFSRLSAPSVASAAAATALVLGGFAGAAPSRAFATATTSVPGVSVTTPQGPGGVGGGLGGASLSRSVAITQGQAPAAGTAAPAQPAAVTSGAGGASHAAAYAPRSASTAQPAKSSSAKLGTSGATSLRSGSCRPLTGASTTSERADAPAVGRSWRWC